MEWVEVVLFLLFIVLPLLQGLLGRGEKGAEAKRPLPQAGEPAAEQELVIINPEPSAWDELFGTGAPAASQQEDEEEDETEMVPAPVGLDTEPVKIVSLEPVEELREVPRAEMFAVADTAPPLDQVQVDRRAEHSRFHARVDAPPAPELAPRRLGPDLRDPGELRRAVLLAEVLGPPRSLQ